MVGATGSPGESVSRGTAPLVYRWRRAPPRGTIATVEHELRGHGVVLRWWRRGDEAAIRAIVDRSAEAFGAWLPHAVKELAEPTAFLDAVAASHARGSAFFYAIEEGGEPVGQCSLHPLGTGEAEIGYWVRTDRTGRGLATAAVGCVTDAALADGYRSLVIHCDEGNLRSAAVARKAGYTHLHTVDLDPALPRTAVQTGREMTWLRRAP